MARGRRSNGEGTHYAYRNGWACQVSYTDPATGTEKRITRYAKTEKEIIQKLNLLKAEIAFGRNVDPASILISELVEQYLQHDAPRVAAVGTLAMYRNMAKKHITPRFKKVKLAQLSVLVVEDWIAYLEGEAKLSSGTIKLCVGVLRRAIDRAMRHEWIHRNVAAIARVPTVTNAKPPVVSREDIAAILQAVEGTDIEGCIKVMLGCGLRIGETLGLTWADLADGHLKVCHQLQRKNGENSGEFVLTSPKTDAGIRMIAMPPLVIEALEKQKRWMLDMVQLRSLEGQAWGNGWNLIFTTRTGNPIGEDEIRRKLKRHLKRAGITLRITPHTLRHIHTSILMWEQVPIKAIQLQLGHRSAKTTLDRYTHLMPGYDPLTAIAIQRSLEPPKEN